LLLLVTLFFFFFARKVPTLALLLRVVVGVVAGEMLFEIPCPMPKLPPALVPRLCNPGDPAQALLPVPLLLLLLPHAILLAQPLQLLSVECGSLFDDGNLDRTLEAEEDDEDTLFEFPDRKVGGCPPQAAKRPLASNLRLSSSACFRADAENPPLRMVLSSAWQGSAFLVLTTSNNHAVSASNRLCTPFLKAGIFSLNLPHFCM
jgi:hypothetical protein